MVSFNHIHLAHTPGVSRPSGGALVVGHLISADMLKPTLAKVHKVVLPNVDAYSPLAGAKLAQSTGLAIYHSPLHLFLGGS